MIGSTRMLSPSSVTLRISSTNWKAVPEPFPAATPTVQELMRSFISCSELPPLRAFGISCDQASHDPKESVDMTASIATVKRRMCASSARQHYYLPTVTSTVKFWYKFVSFERHLRRRSLFSATQTIQKFLRRHFISKTSGATSAPGHEGEVNACLLPRWAFRGEPEMFRT